ncbi:MAG: ABC transporter substrate-binding protein [Propionicimonas sp.]
MRYRKFFVPIAAAAIALTSLAGCSPSSPAPTDPGTASPGGSQAPVPARPLRVWSGNSTPISVDFNPFHVDNALHATFGAIYEPLFFFNELSADPPTGLIGESFQLSEDGKTVTIKLKPNQKWNDGEPLTAEDVVFTFTYANNVNDHLVSAEATDPTTAVFSYADPQFTSVPLLMGNTWIVPKHIWEPIGDKWNDQVNENPVGSGPYLVSATSDASYTTVGNPNFRDGVPAVNEVQYIGLDSNQSSEDLLKTGQLDWVGQFIANPDAVTAGGTIATMNNQLDPTVIIACVNPDLGCKGPQIDPAVRQAINAAIDRASIAEKAFAGLTGLSNPAMLLLPRDQQWLNDPALGESPQQPDAARAEQILTAAGYAKNDKGIYAKDGKPVSLDLFSPDGWTDYNDAAKLIAEAAGKAGIEIKYRTVSEAQYWDPVGQGDFQLAMFGLTQSQVPDPFQVYHEYYSGKRTTKVGDWPNGQNYARYVNPTVDAADKQAADTNDDAVKKQAYATIQTEIARDLPYIPVVLNASQAFYNVKDFTGWPTADDLYANPLPYRAVASAIVLTHLKPAQ